MESFLCFFSVVSLVIFQIGCCKQIATKHTILQNFEIQLGHQDENEICRVQKYLFKLNVLQKHMKTIIIICHKYIAFDFNRADSLSGTGSRFLAAVHNPESTKIVMNQVMLSRP